MKIQILSDLHLESPKAYDIFEIEAKAPYLALLGDIGNIVSHKDECLAFLTQQLRQFQAVFFVPGNHEAYHSNWTETLGFLRAFEEHMRGKAGFGEFVLLERRRYQIPETNIVILGCSLFSAIPPERNKDVSVGLNDFFCTDDWDVEAHNRAHERDLAWLNVQVSELKHTPGIKIVILSHWNPTTDSRSLDAKHAKSPISSAFSSDLSEEICFKSPSVRLWAFGHTHFNCDFTVPRNEGVSNIRLLANQRGYYFAQAEGFDGAKTVDV